MANVQHIFSGEVDPNTVPVVAPHGSHYSDTSTETEYIMSHNGVWHPILPVIRGNGELEYQPVAPIGSLFISNEGSIVQQCGVSTPSGWAALATTESIEGVTAATETTKSIIIDPLNNRLVVNNGGSLSYVDLTALV
ncbi:MAG: hypothetical protein RBR82_12795 [Pseudomonas sp.]|nr:hypothetical protein [Pseudomonas sp.]